MNIFYHLCQINHWKEIFSSHLEHIKSSGLYDAVENIYVCALGNEQLPEYDEKFIGYQNPEIKLYEFFTLEKLHLVSKKKDFLGLYIHSKGVSYPGNAGGQYWHDYLNYHIIDRWREHVSMLQSGYDLSGTQLRSEKDSPAFKVHYSSNIFYFNSRYVRDLPPPSTMDMTNRYNAEMWVGQGSPKCATLCQDWVDYNTKGEFKPAVNV